MRISPRFQLKSYSLFARSSGANGFVLPLSGGADSSSTAAVVGCMCRMACAAAERNAEVAETVRRLMHSSNPYPLPTPKELAGEEPFSNQSAKWLNFR